MRTQSVPAAGGLGQETLTTFYSATNAQDGLTGGFGWGSYVVRADYLPTGEVSSLNMGNTHTYQQAMYYGVGTRRLEGVTTTLETGNIGDDLHELQHATYSYDDAGNVLSAKDTPDPALGGLPSDQQCFTYDWARRLTNAWTPQSGDCATANRTVAGLGGGDPYWKSYSYDVLGNRETSVLHRTAAAGGDATSTYQQPASGTTSVRPHAVTSVTAKNDAGATLGQSSFTYDSAGNMTGRTVAGISAQTLTWDAEGELASIASDEDGNGSVSQDESDEYVYSADGDRLARTQDGDTTVYLPGQEITLDGDTGAVTAKRYYTFAGQTVAIRTGNLANTVTSIFNDPHGTGIIQVGNVSNQVVRRYTDPFGAPRDSAAGLPVGGDGANGSWVGDRGFLDKTEDATGLTAVGARLYDALLGSFISVDPVMDLTDPQQWNAYAYANNNPMTFSDPTGLLLGPLIDGAYTAPTAGEPGSGGWQVAANNTGYTGDWNNGGAGSWSQPGTTYEPPVPSATERARAAEAAEARARAAAEQRARENAAAEAEHKKESFWSQTKDWANNDSDWWGGQNIAAGLGILGTAVGAVALGAGLLGLTAVAGVPLLVVGAVGVGIGALATAIDCTADVDVSCGLSAVGTALGLGGLGSAALAGRMALRATSSTSAVDNIANAGANLDFHSLNLSVGGTALGFGSRAYGYDW
ncbi:RHS repeat-associated core domain-containing protein [Promicromonospora citrea]|uniref:RHS repeat-associated protein n=1 Tax=Promicromonospora citrea TaxID=43677 RepID=A0A8H9L2X9_9MICO|nr:RHS repeat-associated core domain-containing protein [Promicromonospora citrea]NNH50899.1 RHS repeat-associated core domain-containing protein [Promicromonospora citrea]GGM15161.1 hypothetical protein GCM10010102_08380 [Promicromonospora citrea]